MILWPCYFTASTESLAWSRVSVLLAWSIALRMPWPSVLEYKWESVFVMARSSGLILQICDIMALSFHSKHRKFGLIKCNVLLAWSIALSMPWPLVLENNGKIWELAAARKLLPGSFYRPDHSPRQWKAEEGYHLKLVRSNLNFTLRSDINSPAVPHLWTGLGIRLHFFCTQSFVVDATCLDKQFFSG